MLVEKRTLEFLMLAMVVWATTASALAGYYYLQSRAYGEQLSETQNSLDEFAASYDQTVGKYNVLSGEYSELYGNYSFFVGSNYAPLMTSFRYLVENLARNFTTSLSAHKDLNKTYSELLNRYEMLRQKDETTREEFGGLLNEYYKLFNQIAIKELTQSSVQALTLSVTVAIDYGNETIVWLNDTQVSARATLFELTQEIATVDYTYYPLMEPGHILVDSINNKAAYTDPSFSSGYYWIWYYWDGARKMWITGPVGCDAWLLKDGGMYKWNYEYWSWP